MKPEVIIMWFRRDLRLHDNAALYYALKNKRQVVPVFIFDRNILDDLEDKRDRRVEFIHTAVTEMQQMLLETGSSLEVYYGFPNEIFKQLTDKYVITEVFANHDYEQYGIDRDAEIKNLLAENGAKFLTYKDHVILEKDEVMKDDGTPFTVFTPYSKKWKLKLNDFYLRSYPTEKYFNNFFRQSPLPIPDAESMSFERVAAPFPLKEVTDELIFKYEAQRNFPGANGTSKLGVHLRFGTISIRELAQKARLISEVYLNELIWRDFYHMILWQFPNVRKGESFRKEFDRIKWRNNENEFELWCKGITGYPIVDAGMRELNATGFMHNRVRMVTASFLTKHLLIDWRWGEAYFAKKLLDYDYASNNGGWQWAAGSGNDAAPFFRIFNPTLQAQKFDKDLTYINKWVPELNSFEYPEPIVKHDEARKRALQVFGEAGKNKLI